MIRPDWRLERYDSSGKIDLSTNICHDIYLPKWDLTFDKYHNESKLYTILSDHYQIDMSNICIGLGLSELVVRLFMVLKERNYTLNIKGEPTWALMSALQRTFKIPHGNDVVYFANPNGNTGEYVSEPPRGDILTILDLAYSDFCSDPVPVIPSDDTIIMKTLSKSLSIPGCRFGWLFGDITLINRLQELRPGVVSVGSISEYLEDMLLNIIPHVKRMNDTKRALQVKYNCIPSEGNYVLFSDDNDITKLENKFKMKRVNNTTRMSLINTELI